jgi:dTDP-4-dehydrorhamnose reductase
MRIVVTGASGRLGSEVVDRLAREGRHEVFGWSGTERGEPSWRPVDLVDEHALAEALEETDPEAVIHAAALGSAEAVRRDPARAHAVNVEATRYLAEWASVRGRRLVFTSTDLVFDGSKSWNREDDLARPILAYGRSKLDAEPHVLRVPRGLVARLSLLFGQTRAGIPDFFGQAIDALGRGESRSFFEDEFRTPMHYRTAADILARLVESDAVGTIHVGGRERLSRFELMCRAAIASRIDPDLVRPGRQADADLPESRPVDASLDTTRLANLFPSLERPSIEAVLADWRSRSAEPGTPIG